MKRKAVVNAEEKKKPLLDVFSDEIFE